MSGSINTLTPLSALRLLIEENMVKFRYEDYVLLDKIAKRPSSQSAIKWNVNVSNNMTPTGRLVNADARNADSDTTKPALLAIGDYAFTETVNILRTDIEQARSAGVGALRNLADEHFKNKIVKIMRKLNSSLYLGNGTVADAGIVGLQTVSDAQVAYAGLDPAVDTAWTPGLEDENGGVARALTVAMLNDVDVASYRTGTGRYDLIVTTPEIVQAYGQLFNNERALITAQVNGVADVGFSQYQYKGAMIHQDRDCPAGTMYFIDTDHPSLYTYDLPAKDDFEHLTLGGMNFNMRELPIKNQYAVTYEVGVIPQFKMHDRRGISVIRDIQA